LKVIVRNGNVEQALRVLKKKLQKDGRLREIKERQYYVKPSEDKREAKKRGIVNTKKRMKKLALER
jgi:small subunit ribosomal protein S21